ncbi:amylo-alpha-1,6-glucosidase [Hamadaea tsunoensis]|uniref:amylo-alpha-1,6-glucosidase n=1 Tax=Hamadaea tsunoensis TaxID=53368 RepID=UPI0003FA5070|nr:trehalase family glycosidase [Hamadaea tsunoensis]
MTAPPQDPTFSVREIPFSYFGSWFDVSPVIGHHAYAEDLHLVSHQTGLHPILRFVATDGRTRVDAAISATPDLLAWTAATGTVELVYQDAETIRVRSQGLGLRIEAAAATLTPFSGTYLYRDPADGAYVFTVYETGRRYRITVLAGTPLVLGEQSLGAAERCLALPAGEGWEIAIEEYEGARPPFTDDTSFAQARSATRASFLRFADQVAPWRSAETPAAELAAYVLWSATVRPAGFLGRPAVLMSKHWMDKVWSWDHCFNAIALADGHPQLAGDQFMLPFDHQDAGGALPDSVTHSEILYNFVKPPVHGWALGHLRRRLPATAPWEPAEIYRRLRAWTRFWLDFRRAPGQLLPHYQHGNDSGWDNATTFDRRRVVQTADLAALLVLQLRELAVLAEELARPDEADLWTRTAEQIRQAMLDELWAVDRFAARSPATAEVWTSDSLLDLMPIVLGADLPADVAAGLAARVETHLSEYGLATELPSSQHYQSDGYWRGPIWAPATVLIEDGLRRAGYSALADKISARFRSLCEKSGFAENFDAHTGAGLRDRAYTWTASCYLILAAARQTSRRAVS